MELRAAREQSGKTQKQVAQETGITEVSYQRIEYRLQRPSLITAILIARVLNSTVEDLFGAETPDNTKRPDSNRAES